MREKKIHYVGSVTKLHVVLVSKYRMDPVESLDEKDIEHFNTRQVAAAGKQERNV